MTDVTEIDFWKVGDYRSLEEIPDPSDDEIRKVEQEDYEPDDFGEGINSDREDEYYHQSSRYEDS